MYGVVASALALGFAGQFVYSPVFAEGPIDIEIIEMVDDGAGGYKPWKDIINAMPGETHSAIPRVKNNSTVPVEVWMCLSESVISSAGEAVVAPSRAFEIEINENWVLDEVVDASDPAAGNCYKYGSMVEAGAMTEPLFYEVTLSTAFENEHMNATFNLHLDARAQDGNSDDTSGPTVPDSPNTGNNTAIKAFVINSSLIFLAAGIVASLVTLVRKMIRRRG